MLIDALKKDLREELAFTEQAALDTPKNYQIWFHRRAIVERLKDASKELAFTMEVLLEDAKNYHAWGHRCVVCVCVCVCVCMNLNDNCLVCVFCVMKKA